MYQYTSRTLQQIYQNSFKNVGAGYVQSSIDVGDKQILEFNLVQTTDNVIRFMDNNHNPLFTINTIDVGVSVQDITGSFYVFDNNIGTQRNVVTYFAGDQSLYLDPDHIKLAILGDETNSNLQDISVPQDLSVEITSGKTLSFNGDVAYSVDPSELAAFDGSSVLISLDTTTYPDLTEISYVKGVTSAIQGQLNGKLSSSGAGLVECISDNLQTVVDGTYYISYIIPYAGTINSLSHIVGSLTTAGTVKVQINGVDVTGLTAIVPTVSGNTTVATAANTFSAGASITLVFASTLAIANFQYTLKVTR